ncbi:MAG: cytochrome P450 [Hyphomicrobiales bacterium]|nr:cytochrome P450 [Hyphomicrobiales bacterium]MBV8662332.1 cytochrome P450 [Hyphomicrobiales bacterium]
MSLASTSSVPFRPPSPKPRATPIGALGTLYALWRNPLEIWTRAHFEQPVLVGRSVMGMRAVVSDPPAVRRVFLDNAANYRKDALQLRVLRPGLGAGLLTAEGETWRVQRRALAPLFSPRQVADFAPAMHRVASAATERYLARHEPCIVDVSVDMACVTLAVLEQTLFSQGLARGAAAFQQAVSRYFETFGRLDPLDVVGAPQFLPRLGRLRGRATLEFFEKAVDDIIAARRRLIELGGVPPHDLLTLLLRAQDPQTGKAIREEDVRANIVTFIGAGHETTANALTWTLYLLSQSPQWRERAEAEIDARFDPDYQGDLSEKLPVVKAILEEALRLYPPAAFLSREAIAEDWLAGARIPAGTVVTVSPYVLHRHRRLWSDPDAFDPSRFLPENRERIDRYAYLPFGAGSRVCIGMSFAVQEAVIVLAHLLSALRFDLIRGHVVAPIQRVTLRPRFGMRMIVRRRGKAG